MLRPKLGISTAEAIRFGLAASGDGVCDADEARNIDPMSLCAARSSEARQTDLALLLRKAP